MTKKTSTPIDQEFQQFWDAYALKRDRVAIYRRKVEREEARMDKQGKEAGV